jgi:hypothetical protein
MSMQTAPISTGGWNDPSRSTTCRICDITYYTYIHIYIYIYIHTSHYIHAYFASVERNVQGDPSMSTPGRRGLAEGILPLIPDYAALQQIKELLPLTSNTTIKGAQGPRRQRDSFPRPLTIKGLLPSTPDDQGTPSLDPRRSRDSFPRPPTIKGLLPLTPDDQGTPSLDPRRSRDAAPRRAAERRRKSRWRRRPPPPRKV